MRGGIWPILAAVACLFVFAPMVTGKAGDYFDEARQQGCPGSSTSTQGGGSQGSGSGSQGTGGGTGGGTSRPTGTGGTGGTGGNGNGNGNGADGLPTALASALADALVGSQTKTTRQQGTGTGCPSASGSTTQRPTSTTGQPGTTTQQQTTTAGQTTTGTGTGTTTQIVRVSPRAVSATSRCRRTRRGVRCVTTGRVLLRSASRRARAAQATCSGRVSVRVKLGRRTVSSRLARVRSNCRWSSTVNISRRRIRNRRTVRIVARYQGNSRLRPKSARTRTVRIR